MKLLLDESAPRRLASFFPDSFEYQQNVSELPIPVVILVAVRNRVQDLQPLVPGVIAVLSENLQRRIYRVSSQAAGGSRVEM